MQVIGLLFVVLGIVLHLRMLGWIVDPELLQIMTTRWAAASIGRQILIVGVLVLPFAYYAACVFACFAKYRSMKATIIVLVVVVLSVPYFFMLNTAFPMVAKNALWAGLLSFPLFFAKGKADPKMLTGEELML